MPINAGYGSLGPGHVNVEEVVFTEVSNTGGSYTGSVTVPPHAWIIDVRIYGQALWTSGTSALLRVGDGVDNDGWYGPAQNLNVKATDLLVGEVLSFVSAGGKPGAYLNLTSALRTTAWSTLERVITARITTVAIAGSTGGRTRMLVAYATPGEAIPATFA